MRHAIAWGTALASDKHTAPWCCERVPLWPEGPPRCPCRPGEQSWSLRSSLVLCCHCFCFGGGSTLSFCALDAKPKRLLPAQLFPPFSVKSNFLKHSLRVGNVLKEIHDIPAKQKKRALTFIYYSWNWISPHVSLGWFPQQAGTFLICICLKTSMALISGKYIMMGDDGFNWLKVIYI